MKKIFIALFTCFALTSCSFMSNSEQTPPETNFIEKNETFIPETFDNNYSFNEVVYKDNFEHNYNATCRIRANYNTNTNSIIEQASGFVYKHDANNYYVVSSASRIAYKQYVTTNVNLSYKGLFEFRFNDGRKYRGNYVGSYTDFDLVVFSIKTNDYLPVAKLGSSDSLNVGDRVGAIGTVSNSIADLFNTYVEGIVSGLNRQASSIYNNKVISTYPAFQFDAPTNNGMQGGIILNDLDEVVGIINNKENADKGFESLSFGLAIDDVKNIVDNIILNGEYNKILLGFSGGSIDFLNTVPWAANKGIYSGIYVVEVNPNSKAYNAGLEKDSIITAIKTMNGTTININTMEEFQSQLVRLNTGDNITLITARNNLPNKEVKIVL